MTKIGITNIQPLLVFTFIITLFIHFSPTVSNIQKVRGNSIQPVTQSRTSYQNPITNHNIRNPNPKDCAQKPRIYNPDIEEILRAHNEARAHEHEPPFDWDETLAEYARMWAHKRIYDCQFIHSLGPYGENLFWCMKDHWSIAAAVRMWLTEEQFYDRKRFVCQPGKLCGHYTQIVWRDTIKVGCARTKCANNKGYFIICSYDPPGNYPNEDPFLPHNKK